MSSDTKIKENILTELKWDACVDEKLIHVEVKNAVVTLSGQVSSFLEKRAAEKVVERISGVKALVEGLRIVLPDSEIADDQKIASDILNAYRWTTHLPSQKIKLQVENGWVTLAGNVDKSLQRRVAEDIVWAVDGVKGLTNHLLIRGDAIYAETVKQKIEDALKEDVERDAKGILVKIEGHKVILEGEVHSFKEMISAREAALKTPGVTSVDNNLMVGD